MEYVRINKYLAECGVASRREADTLIAEGRVQINGMTAQAGQKVNGSEDILLNGKPVGKPNQKVVLAYYKPCGVTCTTKDSHAQKTVAETLHFSIPVTYVGRLDRDSEGLLLMTNDGDLNERIMRAANYHEKEYIVRLKQEVCEAFLSKMRSGVELKELNVRTRPCEVIQIGKYTFRIVLTQGYNRQIRRMCEACGCEVVALKRIRVMNVTLGELKVGEYRILSGEEQKLLYQLSEVKGENNYHESK